MAARSSRRNGRVHPGGRLLTGTYALGGLTAVLLTLFVGRQVRPTDAELAFGLVNVPVAATFLSVVVLALVTGALVFRKRIGLWLVAGFQVLGIYLGLLRLIPHPSLPFEEAWATRGDLGRGQDIVSMVLAVAILGWLWRLGPEFSGRLRRGSWWRAAATLLAGATVTALVTWGLLVLTRSTGVDLRSLMTTAVRGLSGTAGEHDESWVADAVATLLGLTVIAATAVFLRSSPGASEWTGGREIAIRGLIGVHDEDSLGYFATRRDKSALLSGDGSAAVTYRVIAGVSLASGDPLGRRESCGAAIEAWKAQAREFGWIPAVLSASENGAIAYAEHGLRVLGLGDEAILYPDRFDLRRPSLAPLRQAVRRASRAGLSVEIRRQGDLSPGQLAEIAECADAWRGDEPDRGFSMALNRVGDPADARILHVTAHGRDGRLTGLLSFVPWGCTGISLDVMRRDPEAPNGVTELMVSEVLARAAEHGVHRLSLNFCMFRHVYADAERIGSGSFTRAGYSVLGVLDRFWQLERLYRSNQKYEPEWVPRFLCYEDAVSLPQVALAAGAAEGFIPWPRPRLERGLDDSELAAVRELEAGEPDAATTGGSRSDQNRTRLAKLDELRADGIDPYPAGAGAPAVTIGQILADWSDGARCDVAGRVVQVRALGAVVFARLRDGCDEVQVLLDSATLGREPVRRFRDRVDDGDLLRVRGLLGTSRNGTPSVLLESWQLRAKCLQPIPWRASPGHEAGPRPSDLIVHPEAIGALRRRAAVIAAIRDQLAAEGVMEVDSPMPATGDACAPPSRTPGNAYGLARSLPIAPGLHLKRLLVAGAGPVYAFGRGAVNESADAGNTREFTSLEVCLPEGDYTTMRHLAERSGPRRGPSTAATSSRCRPGIRCAPGSAASTFSISAATGRSCRCSMR